MRIENPKGLVGEEVRDMNGNILGKIDKIWQSWNDDYPGYFFGIKTDENTRDTYFRGTNKLIPIYSDYIREVTGRITLNKTINYLGRLLNKTVQCGTTTYPLEELFEMPVYDKNHSKIGTFCSYVECDDSIRHFGLLLDPYLCESWNLPFNKTLPIDTNNIVYVKDTISLDKTLKELKIYWQNKHHIL
jgi:hypothetical protein